MPARGKIIFPAIAVVVALLFLFPVYMEDLPRENTELVAEKYGGWSGVLHLIVCEGPLSPTKWLNARAGEFKKTREGVFIRVESAAAPTLDAIAKSGVLKPDMLLFYPGTLSAPEGLVPLSGLSGTENLRAGLTRAGEYNGEVFAVPVAMDAHCLLKRADAPADMSVWRIAAPEGAGFSAATVCLFSGNAERQTEEAPTREIALGLPSAPPEATPAPAEAFRDVPPPRAYSVTEASLTAFQNGEADAVVADGRTLADAASLADRLPEMQAVLPSEVVFTDRAAMAGIFAGDAGRVEVCREFLSFLLTDESQQALASAGAFPVTRVSVHTAEPLLGDVEAALLSKRVLLPGAFETAWKTRAETLLSAFLEGTMTAREALALLEASM